MLNIKTKLIHLLGGVTKKEHDDSIRNAKRSASFDAFFDTMKVMEREYGNPEWGDIVYNYVKEYLEALIKS